MVALLFCSSGISGGVFSKPVIATTEAGMCAPVLGGDGGVAKVWLAGGGKIREDGSVVGALRVELFSGFGVTHQLLPFSLPVRLDRCGNGSWVERRHVF